MTRDRIAALDKLGMVWDARQTQWERQYQAALAYYREHGHLRVGKGFVTRDGICLGTWIQMVRQCYKQKKLTAGQIKRLEAIGMVWDEVSGRWERNYQAAQAYYHEHGNLKVPVSYDNEEGFHLGRWVQDVRKSYRRGIEQRANREIRRYWYGVRPGKAENRAIETGHSRLGKGVCRLYEGRVLLILRKNREEIRSGIKNPESRMRAMRKFYRNVPHSSEV